ncbi:hypothetical protein ACFT7S_27540 [Streptomyces sp. NPDC057136]|uniref:hypothetical protein n=1 Tax=Streptomyces sp. NPDC057136 TaxID=3346029 RepID=UPI00363DADB2
MRERPGGRWSRHTRDGGRHVRPHRGQLQRRERIWIFSGGGSFTNEGDGGWGNWAFYGLWDRNGSTVNFRPTDVPTVPAVPKGETPFPGDTPITPGVPANPGPRPGYRTDTAATTPAGSGRPPVGFP